MKKVYMNPKGKVVALHVNENISSSRNIFETESDPYGIKYMVVGDKKFIQTSDHEACSLGDEAYNRFFDLIVCALYDLDPNCWDGQ